jgi:16S rRNA (adenine1518-N6/adenine1519-N6)-dimethyltransferase
MAVFILQDEVVGRIGALPGDRKRGLLSVVMQSVYEVSPLFKISPGSFNPRPQVWSRVVRLSRGGSFPSVSSVRPAWDVASMLFRQRRKMIGGLLSRVYGRDAVEHIKALGVDLTRRPETLTLPELEMITQVIQDVK